MSLKILHDFGRVWKKQTTIMICHDKLDCAQLTNWPCDQSCRLHCGARECLLVVVCVLPAKTQIEERLISPLSCDFLICFTMLCYSLGCEPSEWFCFLCCFWRWCSQANQALSNILSSNSGHLMLQQALMHKTQFTTKIPFVVFFSWLASDLLKPWSVKRDSCQDKLYCLIKLPTRLYWVEIRATIANRTETRAWEK